MLWVVSVDNINCRDMFEAQFYKTRYIEMKKYFQTALEYFKQTIKELIMNLINEYGYTQDLKEYCKANDLSYEKICSMPMSANDNFIAILYVDPKEKFIVNNEEPAELLLLAERTINGIKFTSGKTLHEHCGIHPLKPIPLPQQSGFQH